MRANTATCPAFARPRQWPLPSPSTSGSLGMAGEAEWRNVLLGDLAASTRNALVGGPFGSDLVSSDYSSTGVPVIRGENVSSGRWIGGDFVFVPPAKAEQLSANTA